MKGMVGVLLAAVVLWGAFLFMAHRAEAEEASGWNKLWDGLLGGATARRRSPVAERHDAQAADRRMGPIDPGRQCD